MRNCGPIQYKLSFTFKVCAFLFLFLLFILGLVLLSLFACFPVSSFFVVIMIAFFPFPSFDVLGVVNSGKVMGISGLLKCAFLSFSCFFSAPLGDCM